MLGVSESWLCVYPKEFYASLSECRGSASISRGLFVIPNGRGNLSGRAFKKNQVHLRAMNTQKLGKKR